MAMVIENTTICPLCNDVLNSKKEYIMTPNLISNQLDQIALLSDTGVHLECLEKFSLRDKLFKYIKEYDDCIYKVKLLIEQYNPQDVIIFNLLTSDEFEPLYKYNYSVLLKKNIMKWKNLDDFKKVAGKFLTDGKWQGINGFNYLEYLLNTINDLTDK